MDDEYQPQVTFQRLTKSLIRQQSHRSVCEVGAGANPALPINFIQEHGLDCVLVDISPDELAKAPGGYEKVVADLTSTTTEITTQRFSLVMSQMLAEHVSDPVTFHRNVHDLLVPRGYAVHLFPTLFSLPFLANRLFPEGMSSRILKIFAPKGRESEGRHGKFPAYYRWCRGPSRRQARRFRDVGFEVVEYVGFFGHLYYERFPRLDALEQGAAGFLTKHPVPALSSYAVIVLRRSS